MDVLFNCSCSNSHKLSSWLFSFQDPKLWLLPIPLPIFIFIPRTYCFHLSPQLILYYSSSILTCKHSFSNSLLLHTSISISIYKHTRLKSLLKGDSWDKKSTYRLPQAFLLIFASMPLGGVRGPILLIPPQCISISLYLHLNQSAYWNRCAGNFHWSYVTFLHSQLFSSNFTM